MELVNSEVDCVTVIIRIAEATMASTWLKPAERLWCRWVGIFKG
jgi:hypothetical protein